MRIRGSLYIDALFSATSGEIHHAFGIGVVSSDAFAVGISAMPDPFTDASYPWMWWDYEVLTSQTGELFASRKIIIDVKAMRKIDIGQTLAFVVQTRDASSVSVARAGADTRALVQWAGS